MTDQTKALAPYDQLKELIVSEDIEARFKQLLGDRAPQFIASVLSVVAGDEKLREASPHSIIVSALKAAVLDLPIEPSLGMAWIIPYNKRREVDGKWVSELRAQFQTGYKGEKTLALRTGMYKVLNVVPVYQGQSIEQHPLTGAIQFSGQRVSDERIGWAGYYRLLNGYEEYVYWTIEEVHEHAKKYSQSYKYDGSAWKTDAAKMEKKTTLAKLLKSAPKSIQLQRAWAEDELNFAMGFAEQRVVNEDMLDAEFHDLLTSANGDSDLGDEGDPIADHEGTAPDLTAEVIAAAIEHKYTQNEHSAQDTLKHCTVEFESVEQGVAWFKNYRHWRELDADTKKAAKYANDGEGPETK